MMRRISFFVALVSLSARAEAPAAANRVLVRFKSASVSLSLATEGTRPLGELSAVRFLPSSWKVLRYSTGLSPLEAAQRLAKDPRVEWAQPDYLLSLPVMPNARLKTAFADAPKKKPEVRTPYPLPNPPIEDAHLLPDVLWGLFQIGAVDAWKTQRGSRSVLVAHIDSGIDYSHMDLMNNRWDQIGYDLVAEDNLPFDEVGHGTHTAGIIGAVGGNGKGVSGVSQSVSLMAINFIRIDGDKAQGNTSDAIRAIDYAISKGARIINASWGGPADDAVSNRALEEAVDRAGAAGMLIVAAAGNDAEDDDKHPSYPASYRKDFLITVAASNKVDDLSYFSNYGKQSVHVAAPGENILSTIPYDQYAELNGTSMAAPYVTGLAALLLAEKPSLKAADLKRIILETVDRIPSLDPYVATGGRINVRAALERVRRP